MRLSWLQQIHTPAALTGSDFFLWGPEAIPEEGVTSGTQGQHLPEGPFLVFEGRGRCLQGCRSVF